MYDNQSHPPPFFLPISRVRFVFLFPFFITSRVKIILAFLYLYVTVRSVLREEGLDAHIKNI